MKDRARQHGADKKMMNTIDITSVNGSSFASKSYFGTTYNTQGKKNLYVVTSKASGKAGPKTEIINPSLAAKKVSRQLTLSYSPSVAEFCKKLLSTEKDEETTFQKTEVPLRKGRNHMHGRISGLILPEPKLSNEHSSNPRNYLRFINAITDEPPPKFRYITNHV